MNMQVYPDTDGDGVLLYACLDVLPAQCPVLNTA